MRIVPKNVSVGKFGLRFSHFCCRVRLYNVSAGENHNGAVMPMSRRETLVRVGAGLFLGSTFCGRSSAQSTTVPVSTRPAKPPAIPLDEVREFVGAAHGNIVRVREMLVSRPSIVNATWDWGGGDFETALGGASHMGRHDIAKVLLDAGARLDLFAAAMLGHLPIVSAALELDPAMLNTPGPHGIALITHAERGGEAARPVLEYLRGLR